MEDLKAYGFELNEYDPFVANATVNGTQMTVTWHVDDLQISHKLGADVEKFVSYMRLKYGDELTVNQGNYHDYLGADHDYSEAGKVKLSMIKHLDRIFQDFPEEIGKPASLPASDHLFMVRDSEEMEN